MRLYVHFEPPDEALAWTKRLQFPLVNKSSAIPTLRSILCCFCDAYNSKFRSKTSLKPENVDVYVEFNQNATSRRRLDSLDVSITYSDNFESYPNNLLHRSETACNFELVVVPKEPGRKMLDNEPPSALEPKTLSSKQLKISPEVGKNLKLDKSLKLAATYMMQQKFRAAREIYLQVMTKEPQNPEALVALGDILVANGQHEKAIRRYFLKCWKTHRNECGATARATVVYASALRLAEGYIVLKKLDEAVLITNEMYTFLRVNGGEERLEMEKQVDVLKAQALYDTKNFGKQDQAISLLEHLLPDLTASTLNLDALLVYAKIAYDRGKKSEALSMVLRVLVNKRNDRAVKMTLVSFLADANSIDRLKEAVPLGSPSAGAAYAFIATILKDFGAVDQAITCFQLAQASDSQNASYALNHAHALEICCRYEEAYDVLALFFRKNKMLSVGSGENGAVKLLAGSFVDILDRANAWDGTRDVARASNSSIQSKKLQWSINWVSREGGYAVVTAPSFESKLGSGNLQVTLQSLQTRKTNSLLEVELDLLACFFTIVKILFVNGQLFVLPSLIRVLEPIRLGRKLHRTTIRNEQAYYACIAQLLSVDKDLVILPPQVSQQTSPASIYVCGDSHTLATAWREIRLHGQPALLRPALVTGLKHWHLRKESTFYPKLNFWRVLMNIPSTSRVILLFGEIDCREGFFNAVEKCKYETIEEGMVHTIDIFMEVLSDVVKQYHFDVYIHPIVPVLDETRSVVIQYNNLFRKRVVKSSICKWLDFFNDLICDDPPKLRSEFRLDGTHLHPSYVSKLEAAFR